MPFRRRFRKTRKARNTRKRVGSRRASRRFGLRRTRRGRRLQSGGGHKEDIIDLIVGSDNFPAVLEFFQSMDQPIWHADFPKKDGDDYLVMIKEGEADNADPAKIIFIKLKKLAEHFAEVTMETFENKKPQDFLDQYRMDLLQPGAEYTGIRDASKEIFDIGA